MDSGPGDTTDNSLPYPPPRAALDQTTFVDAPEEAPDNSRAAFATKRPKPPLDRLGLSVVCAIILFSGLMTAFAGFFLASNPEKVFSSPMETIGAIDDQGNDSGDKRNITLIPLVLFVDLFFGLAVYWHKHRTFQEVLAGRLKVAYYSTMLLFVSIVASFFIVPGLANYTIASIPVLRVYWFTLPFTYFLAVIYSRPGRPWHRIMVVAAFALWVSLGPGLDIPEPSVAKVVYNISGWMTLAFIVPYGLWTSHFPTPEMDDPKAGPAGRRTWNQTNFSRIGMATVAVVGSCLIVLPMVVSFSAADPHLRGHSSYPQADGPSPLPGPRLRT